MKNNLKPSEFNLITDYLDNQYIIFNTFSGSLIKIGKDLFNEIVEFSSSENKKEDLENISNKLFDLGFLIKKEFDEKSFIKLKNRQWRHNPVIYSIAILPNIDCNFNCKYCFENIEPKYMSEETICNIEKFIENRLKNNLINNLGVSWYGGEPLLSKNIIKRLSKTFRKVNSYRATLFTNGFAFDEDFINNIPNYGIDLIHITLDGPSEINDKYRYLKNKQIGTYKKIKENIEKITNKYGNKVYFNIRVNLDYENQNYYQQLIEEFKEINKNNISFILHKICKTESGNGSKFCGEISQNDYESILSEGRESLARNGFKDPLDFLPKNIGYHHCFVGLDNGLTINYNGAIHKCFGDANPSQNIIGYLNSDGEINYLDEHYYKWVGYDYFENLQCRNCKLLPICMGGCTHQRLGLTPNAPSLCDMEKAIEYVSNIVTQVYELKNSIK